MRCMICDNSDVGLSNFRPDHGYAHNFVKVGPVDFICSYCYTDSIGYDEELEDVLDDTFDGEDQ